MPSYTFGGKNGRKFNLKESDDRIVVRTRNQRTLNEAVQTDRGREVLNRFDVEQRFPDADVSILTAKQSNIDNIALRDEARSILKEEADLRFAGRVLENEETKESVLYTENIFLQFHASTSTERCESILQQFKLRIKMQPKFAPNSYFVSAEEGTGLAVFDITERLLQLPEVELCHPELITGRGEKMIHPLQWHLQATTITGVDVEAHANVANAQTITRGKGVVVAIIDDGVDIDHQEFKRAGKVVFAKDITLGTNDPRPKQWYERHGTACAGVACADGIQATGIAPDANLMPIRMSSALGSFNEAQAFIWAAENGADIISCSWGPKDGSWTNPNDPLHTTMSPLPDSTRLAIEYAATKGRNGKGCVVLFAAGNGREDTKYDGYASCAHVIAIAASNDRNKRSVYSDYGDAVWCCFPSGDKGASQFDQLAPLTSGIYTTDRQGGVGYSSLDYTDTFSGTSASTPGIAGVCALVLSANPDLTREQVREVLRQSCERIDAKDGKYDAKGHSIYYGYGRVDALKAVEIAQKVGAPAPAVLTSNVHIIAALVNPVGSDYQKETVTIRNEGPENITLLNWAVCDEKGRLEVLPNVQVDAGKNTIIKLKKIKLANTGGVIRLLNPQGNEIHNVRYTAKQANISGKEVEF